MTNHKNENRDVTHKHEHVCHEHTHNEDLPNNNNNINKSEKHTHECQHDHSEHDNCNHEHHQHDHSNCGHSHHSHEPHERYNRYQYTDDEIIEFSKKSTDDLIELVNNFLTEEIYGKAVPLLEVIFLRLSSEQKNMDTEINNIFETKHHLALAYGIIGEHAKSLPLWKEVLKTLESEDDTSEILEAYYNAALSAEQAQNEKEFILLLDKGLEIAKSNDFEDWEAAFEHELGIHFMDKNDLETAKIKFERAIEIRTVMEDDEGLVTSKYFLASLYEAKKDMENAKKLYEEALIIAKKEGVRENVAHERTLIEERLSAIQNHQLQSKLLKF